MEILSSVDPPRKTAKKTGQFLLHLWVLWEADDTLFCWLTPRKALQAWGLPALNLHSLKCTAPTVNWKSESSRFRGLEEECSEAGPSRWHPWVGFPSGRLKSFPWKICFSLKLLGKWRTKVCAGPWRWLTDRLLKNVGLEEWINQMNCQWISRHSNWI